MRDQKVFAQRTIDIPRIPTTSLNNPISQQSQPVGDKIAMTSFSYEMELDEERQRERVDYTVFDYKQEGASTVVFIPPPAGWSSTMI